jgi:hypothetical protein
MIAAIRLHLFVKYLVKSFFIKKPPALTSFQNPVLLFTTAKLKIFYQLRRKILSPRSQVLQEKQKGASVGLFCDHRCNGATFTVSYQTLSDTVLTSILSFQKIRTPPRLSQSLH